LAVSSETGQSVGGVEEVAIVGTVKIKPELVSKLESANASELLEVTLQLESPDRSPAASSAGSRAEKIVALKEAFNQDAASVEEAVRNAGGEVTGRAWINQTLRARVPAQKIRDLCDHEKVSAVDTTRTLKAE
jgi:hypothetical protein